MSCAPLSALLGLLVPPVLAVSSAAPASPATFVPPTLAEWGVVLASYVFGSVPFGFLLAKLLKGIDLREIGSGNIGATNAMRALGKPLGILTFLLDAGKGAAAILFLVPLFARPDVRVQTAALAGIAAVVGHCFSIFLSFGGGKGVATGLGALMTFDPWIFVIGGLVWLCVLVTVRWVALASLCMGFAFPIVAWWRLGASEPAVVVAALMLTVLILVRHRSNIGRMLAGTEPKAFAKRSGGTTP